MLKQDADLRLDLESAGPVSNLQPDCSFSINRQRGHDWLCRTVLLLVCIVVWIPRFTGPINFRWDASAYYILGTALSQGHGYRLLNEPGEIEAVQYPPLLPMTVAALQLALGTTDFFKVGCALRLTYFVFSALLLLMSYALVRKLLSPVYALIVGVMMAISFSTMLEPSDVLYADLPFAMVSLAFLLCQQKSERPMFVAASGLLAAAAYLFRTAGLALFLAWIAESLIRRRFGQAAVRVAICALPVLLWQAHVWRVTRSYEYQHPAYSYQRADYYYPNVTYAANSRLIDPFQPELGHTRLHDIVGRLVRNIAAVPLGLGESTITRAWFAPFFSTQLHQALRVPLSDIWRKLTSGALKSGLFTAGLLALIGAILVARGQQWFLSLYFATTIASIVVTPWQNQFWRYLAPVAPLTLSFLLLTLFAIRRWLRSQHLGGASAVSTLVTTIPPVAILLVQVAAGAHLFRSMGSVSYYDRGGREQVFKLFDYGSEWHALDPSFEWIRRNAPTTAVIATTVPQLAYLRTGRKAVLPPFERDPDTASRLLDEVPVNYLVIDSFRRPGISERYAAPLVAQKPQNWRLVFTALDLETHVYERTR